MGVRSSIDDVGGLGGLKCKRIVGNHNQAGEMRYPVRTYDTLLLFSLVVLAVRASLRLLLDSGDWRAGV